MFETHTRHVRSRNHTVCNSRGQNRVLVPANGVQGDGACMFRALVQAEHNENHDTTLTQDQEDVAAKALRDMVVDYIRTHEKQYTNKWGHFNIQQRSFRKYVQNMGKTDTYGTELELMIASMLLGRNICVTARTVRGSEHSHTVSPIENLGSAGRRPPLYLHLWNSDTDYAHYTYYRRTPHTISTPPQPVPRPVRRPVLRPVPQTVPRPASTPDIPMYIFPTDNSLTVSLGVSDTIGSVFQKVFDRAASVGNTTVSQGIFVRVVCIDSGARQDFSSPSPATLSSVFGGCQRIVVNVFVSPTRRPRNDPVYYVV